MKESLSPGPFVKMYKSRSLYNISFFLTRQMRYSPAAAETGYPSSAIKSKDFPADTKSGYSHTGMQSECFPQAALTPAVRDSPKDSGCPYGQNAEDIMRRSCRIRKAAASLISFTLSHFCIPASRTVHTLSDLPGSMYPHLSRRYRPPQGSLLSAPH